MKAHLYLACSVGLVLWLLPAASAVDANMQGTVVDSEGAAIANAHVVVRADLSGRRNRTRNADSAIDTDGGGRFMLELQPGFYDVCVMADAFSPSCQKVLVTRDDVLKPRIQLKADPEVMKRIGDAFPAGQQGADLAPNQEPRHGFREVRQGGFFVEVEKVPNMFGTGVRRKCLMCRGFSTTSKRGALGKTP